MPGNGRQILSRQAIVVHASDRQPPLGVVGTSVAVLASNQQTGGLGFTLQHGDEGTGPPPHCHPWDEGFYVIGGCIDFSVAGETTRVEAGALVYVPGGTTHAFTYGPGGATMLEVTGEGSTAAGMFGDFATEMPGEIDITKVSEIFVRHGAQLMI